MIHYLYVKTHKKTGLKYLGKTTQDPYKYKGSGVRWVNHLKVHGVDIDTQILHECSSLNEVKILGRYYSDLWNIVENNDWANLKPEDGDGAATGKYNHCKKLETRQKIGKRMKIISTQRVENNTHNFQTQLNGSSLSERRVKNGTHNFIGKSNPNYDSNIYTFKHKDGTIVKTTRSEMVSRYSLDYAHIGRLIKRKRKTHKNWSIIFEKSINTSKDLKCI
jgi:hypothetical protein